MSSETKERKAGRKEEESSKKTPPAEDEENGGIGRENGKEQKKLCLEKGG